MQSNGVVDDDCPDTGGSSCYYPAMTAVVEGDVHSRRSVTTKIRIALTNAERVMEDGFSRYLPVVSAENSVVAEGEESSVQTMMMDDVDDDDDCFFRGSIDSEMRHLGSFQDILRDELAEADEWVRRSERTVEESIQILVESSITDDNLSEISLSPLSTARISNLRDIIATGGSLAMPDLIDVTPECSSNESVPSDVSGARGGRGRGVPLLLPRSGSEGSSTTPDGGGRLILGGGGGKTNLSVACDVVASRMYCGARHSLNSNSILTNWLQRNAVPHQQQQPSSPVTTITAVTTRKRQWTLGVPLLGSVVYAGRVLLMMDAAPTSAAVERPIGAPGNESMVLEDEDDDYDGADDEGDSMDDSVSSSEISDLDMS